MRIAIVNDLEMVITVLQRIVESTPEHEVAWIARNGQEAVLQCSIDVPDLILMDLIMPVMNGADATREIMRHSPCAILIVTASVGSNASLVFEAMGFGALDATNTPSLAGGQALLHKIAMIGRLLGKEARAPSPVTSEGAADAPWGAPPLLAIGASTGGPMALSSVLASLPKPFPAAIAIVQHVDTHFAPGLAQWLSGQTRHRVEVATEGMTLAAGKVVLAGKEDHLVVARNLQLKYSREPVETSYRPSVDVFFQSLARHWPKAQAKRSAALLLTGMGRDGAAGMKSLADAGWLTIAQDAATSVVYGMPKAAAELGAAKQVLPLSQIGEAIGKFFSVKTRGTIDDE